MKTTTATIASGASLSGAINLHAIKDAGSSMTGDGVHLCAIQMPAAWDTANLSFQASADGITYSELYDMYGAPYAVVSAASRLIVLNVQDFSGLKFLKIRSGTAASAVNQTADRTLTLILRPI